MILVQNQLGLIVNLNLAEKNVKYIVDSLRVHFSHLYYFPFETAVVKLCKDVNPCPQYRKAYLSP